MQDTTSDGAHKARATSDLTSSGAAPARSPVFVIDNLTPRQTELLPHILGNQTVKQIAAEMFLSPTTVQAYIGEICERLGLSDGRAGIQSAVRPWAEGDPLSESMRPSDFVLVHEHALPRPARIKRGANGAPMLTLRDKMAARMLLEEYTEVEIGEVFGIKGRALTQYVQRVLDKLNVESAGQLIKRFGEEKRHLTGRGLALADEVWSALHAQAAGAQPQTDRERRILTAVETFYSETQIPKPRRPGARRPAREKTLDI